MLTTVQLTDLLRRLEDARRESTGPGAGLYCPAPNTGPAGETTRRVGKPNARKPVGHAYPDGTKLAKDADGLHVIVPLGVHGRGHLGIDPATGEIGCVLCAAAKGGA